jgi:hypothetical protein
MEAYTYDPAGPIPPPGDVSNFTYDATSQDYQYRCFTNPIWVKAGGTLKAPKPKAIAGLKGRRVSE